MKTKKIVVIGIIAALTFSMSACGNKDTTSEEDTATEADTGIDYSGSEWTYYLRTIKMSAGTGDDPKYIISPGESRKFSVGVYSMAMSDPDENGRVYTDERDETTESLEEAGMKIEWSTTDGEMDGIEFNGDAEIESESPLSATITFPSEGNYRVRAVLLDENGKHLAEGFYKDDLIVE